MSPLPADDAVATAVTLFGRLLERGLGALEGCTISQRGPDGTLVTLDAQEALGRLIGEIPSDAPRADRDPEAAAFHAALLAAFPGWTTAVSGVALHLRDLIAEEMALPEATSMMRKRGIRHVADHLVAAGACRGAAQAETIAAAWARTEANGMRHVLIVEPDGTVHVGGPAPAETMAHWSNVEFSAQVAVLRAEERVLDGMAESDPPA